MKKKIIIPVFMLTCLFFLAGCTKVSLTGDSNTGANNAPSDMGTPPDGFTPPSDMGTPPDGLTPPSGGPTN